MINKIQKVIIKTLKKVFPSEYHEEIFNIYCRASYVFNIGDKHTCPVCGRHFKKFISGIFVGDSDKSYGICPCCHSLERHRLLYLYLKDKTDFFTGDHKVLHVAPERSLQDKFEKMSNLYYVSSDLRSRLAKVKIDITNVSYKDNSFDVILCSHVLEHILDDRKAMTELFRILKPGGWAIIQSPVDSNKKDTFEDKNIVSPEDRERFFGISDHVRIYGLDYKKRLENVGFIVKVDDYVKTINLNEVQKYGLASSENIYLCTKS